MNIHPHNAAQLLEEALLLDGKEPGEHVEALRAQFRRQVIAGYADRAQEREIRNHRPRGPATTPRTRVRVPSRAAPLSEKSDADVLFAFDKISEGIARAIAHNKPNPNLYERLENVAAELRRRGMWVAA